jgi:hypothetical protein
VALGSIDMDTFLEEQLHDISDWERNLQMLKAAARDAERLPNEVTFMPARA